MTGLIELTVLKEKLLEHERLIGEVSVSTTLVCF